MNVGSFSGCFTNRNFGTFVMYPQSKATPRAARKIRSSLLTVNGETTSLIRPFSVRRCATYWSIFRESRELNLSGRIMRSKCWNDCLTSLADFDPIPTMIRSSYSCRNSAHVFLSLFSYVPVTIWEWILSASVAASVFPRFPGPQDFVLRLPSGSIHPTCQLAFAAPCFFT